MKNLTTEQLRARLRLLETGDSTKKKEMKKKLLIAALKKKILDKQRAGLKERLLKYQDVQNNMGKFSTMAATGKRKGYQRRFL